MPKTILLVEDDRVDAEAYRIRLETAGYGVTLASTGEAAVATAVASPPSLIIMDIGLDSPDGIETVGLLRARGVDSPVVYLSNYGDADTLDRAEATMPYGYLFKSAPDQVMRITISNAIERRSAELVLKEALAKANGGQGLPCAVVQRVEAVRNSLVECLKSLDQVMGVNQDARIGSESTGAL
jgi:DNA-binding NarL/FixJ family response regulator